MSTNQIQSLNADLTNEHIKMPYPHLMMQNPNDAVALVLTSLPTGDLPVICTYKGSTRQLIKIKRSALSILPLSKVVNLVYVKSAVESVPIKSPSDILEVLA